MRQTIQEVFQSRDGMNETEAQNYANEMQDDVLTRIGEGASYDEIEEMFLDEDLEMDYFEDFI